MKLLVGLLTSCGLMFGMVDINHADVKELSMLNGIGEAKAQNIVEHRKANGCFETVEALMNVKGIGQGIIEKNKTNMKVTACK